ncbi:MAG: STAS domain-containing protein [Spirochaetota bacterium]|nr:STAS domain-containing protein [Spirochaetota bacterium]
MDMKFELEITTHSSRSVIALVGDISADAGTRIRDAYDQVCRERPNAIIFDFAEVRYINSEGVAIFFSLARNMTETSPKMVFAALNPNMQSIIKIVGLTDFVHMVSDVDAWLKESEQKQS